VHQLRERALDDSIALRQRLFALRRKLEELLPPVGRGALTEHQSTIHEAIENALHGGWSDAAMARDFGGNLFAVVKALQHPQLAD
jgi:hypothetical protein